MLKFDTSRDAVFFLGTGQRAGNAWAVSMDSGVERPLTDLVGRSGTPGLMSIPSDPEFVYFTWDEDLGDIWVMDVVVDED